MRITAVVDDPSALTFSSTFTVTPTQSRSSGKSLVWSLVQLQPFLQLSKLLQASLSLLGQARTHCEMAEEEKPAIVFDKAKSGRSTCRATGEKIEKDEYRVGMEVRHSLHSKLPSYAAVLNRVSRLTTSDRGARRGSVGGCP